MPPVPTLDLDAAPSSAGMSAARLAEIDTTAQELIAEREISGAVTMVARHGKVVQLGAYGVANIDAGTPMQMDTIFRIYSMTKPIGTAATMMLMEQGLIDLDAPAALYLPELADLTVAVDAEADAGSLTFVAAEREMTVRDLLRHTSGLPGAARYTAGNTALGALYRQAGMDRLHERSLEEIVGILGTVPLVYQPGTQWQYSIAADVLGRLIEVVSGMPFDQFLAQRIFEPLGMGDTGFFVPPEQRHRFAAMHGPAGDGSLQTTLAPQGGSSYLGSDNFLVKPKFLSNGGGLVSTASDFMRFCLMLAGRGALGAVRLLQPETVAEMMGNQLPDSLIPIDKAPRERYDGLGFGFGGSVRVYQTDWVPAAPVGEYGWIGGASTEFWIAPREGLVVIVLLQRIPFSRLSWAVKPHVYAAIEG